MTSQQIPPDFIKSILSANGYEKMSDEMIMSISTETEKAFTELFTEAMKFMYHSKRKELKIQDVNSALKLRQMEPFYGYNKSVPLYYQRLPTNSEIFIRQEDTVDLNNIIHPKDFPMIPREISIGCHWLTVEGIQPLIPQNPSLEINEVTKQEQTIETKPIIRHSLSKELQMYYDMIVEILNTNNTVKIKHCLDSVRTDNGLQQLTPYFIRYISNHTFTNLSSLEIVNNMLSLVSAMSDNENINLEPYLHQLFPVILTLVVTKQIGTNPMDDHWSVRCQAAGIVKKLRDRYCEKYSALHSRLLQTYLRAITDKTKPLTTQFGGIVGITAMGPRVVYGLLFPAMKTLKERYLGTSVECKKCSDALYDAAFVLASRIREMVDGNSEGNELMEIRKELVEKEFSVEKTMKSLIEIFGNMIDRNSGMF